MVSGRTRLIVVVLCCCACICITFYAVANTALTAARHIHNEIVNSLLKAPVDRPLAIFASSL